MEENSLERHEYHDGEILAMSGGTFEHSLIVSNVNRALGNALVGKPCRVLDSNLKVGIIPSRRFVYPDRLVICGSPQFDPRDSKRQAVTNTHRAIDTGRISNVLVSQTSASVQTFFRQTDGTWLFTPFSGIEGVVKLRSLDVQLRMADVYAGVEFPEVPETDDVELIAQSPHPSTP